MENLDLLRARASVAVNDRQHNRMVRDKARSFHRALLYSYQHAWVKKDEPDAQWVLALINPDKVKFDYDEKVISIDWMHDYKPGDSFEWPRDSGIHWLILKQELTELAYFRGNCRRAQWIEATDPETKEKFGLWMAVRGPVETKLNTIQKHGIAADVPNLTLHVYVKKEERTERALERYQRFEFENRFWKVQTIDVISTPGIIEFTAEEDYECHGDEYLIEPTDPNPPKETEYQVSIEGETFIKPRQAVTYKVNRPNFPGTWSVVSTSQNKDIDDVVEYETHVDNSFTITWLPMISGEFDVVFHNDMLSQDLHKTIVVESLF